MSIHRHSACCAVSGSIAIFLLLAAVAALPARAADLVVEGGLTVEQDAQVDGALTVGGLIAAGTGPNVLTNAAGLIDGGKIQPGTVTSDEIGTSAVGMQELAVDSVTANHIMDGSVGADEIAMDAVGASEIAANAVTASEIATGAVGSDEIINNSITADDIGTNAVGSDEIINNSITAGDIGTNAVGSDEITNNSITAGDIGSDQVGADELDEDDGYTVAALYAVTEAGIGTDDVPYQAEGLAKLALHGTDASTAAPYVQFTTTANKYPLMAFAPYAHDNMAIRFDCYSSASGPKSSDVGSNATIGKYDDTLRIRYSYNVAAGSTVTPQPIGFEMGLTDGSIKLPAVYSYQLTCPIENRRQLWIDDTGLLGYILSSIRYKENVRDVAEEDTGWIHALRPVMFDYKDHAMGTNQCGLIAEEVAEVHPAIVSYERELTYVPVGPTEKDPNNQADDVVPVITTTDVPETVNYPDLIVPMLAEIQRLKKQVDALETRLAALEANK